jgi:MarR family 2-MHQ and catechol resistance regulon transcriptional repressor
MKVEDEDIRQSTFVLLSRVGDMLNRHFDAELRKFGSNRTRFNVLSNLITHSSSMTPSFISKRILRAGHSVTAVIDSLEKVDFVQRQRYGKDRRSLNVVLTEKGKRYIKDKAPVTIEIGHNTMACLDDDELRQLNTILKKIRKHLLGIK